MSVTPRAAEGLCPAMVLVEILESSSWIFFFLASSRRPLMEVKARVERRQTCFSSWEAESRKISAVPSPFNTSPKEVHLYKKPEFRV